MIKNNQEQKTNILSFRATRSKGTFINEITLERGDCEALTHVRTLKNLEKFRKLSLIGGPKPPKNNL